MSSNQQEDKLALTVGAIGYRTRSDISATDPRYLVAGSQNVLINEATDDDGDKVETRLGYTMKGATSTDRDKIRSQQVFKTKVGDVLMLRFDANGDLEFYSETTSAWEELLTGLNGDYPLRFTTAWNASELIRALLFVNHSATLYEWSGATATIAGDASVTAATITIQETIATRGFLTAGTRSIRIKDSGGTWRETVYTAQSGSDFTVSTDLSAYTFDANAPVVQVVRSNATTPASGFTNDIITVSENHVYVASHSSAIVYMSKSTSYADFTFSSPRVATDGWQFVVDDFMIGFAKNLTGEGKESVVFFAGSDWIYRVEFVDLGDTSISQIANIKPIIVSSSQGAVTQELIANVKNSIVYLNSDNELLELGVVENITTPQQVPLSDPIKPDFIAADFTNGAILFHKNNLYVTAATSGTMFILAFRETSTGTRRFWQPPQILPVSQMSDYGGDLIGHSNAVTESYVLFDGTNDNGQPIAFKVHYAYNNFGRREKLKIFDKYFSELYLSSNALIQHKIVYEYLGAKAIKTYEYNGNDAQFLFSPTLEASLGINALGTAPLGGAITASADFLKYRRFKKVAGLDFYEMQVRYECDTIDARFQIVSHGANAMLSNNAPAKITS